MDAHSVLRTERLDGFRDYLRLLACIQLPPSLCNSAELSAIVDEAVDEARRSADLSPSPASSDMRGRLRAVLLNVVRRRVLDRSTSGDPKQQTALSAFVDRAAERIKHWLAVDQLSAPAPEDRERPLHRLACALGRLPADERILIELKYLQAGTLAAICARTGESELALAGRLRRALVRLRELLTEDS
jgi:RNA polymerase sigma-70 factor, ECF subfamily